MRWRRETGNRGREEGEQRDGERKSNMGSRVEVERRWMGRKRGSGEGEGGG